MAFQKLRQSLMISCISGILMLGSCRHDPSGPGETGEQDARLLGGATTVFDATSGAFSLPAPNLSASSLSKHLRGDAAFEAVFVTPPAPVNGGLGPVFNNTSCNSCHTNDGRGQPPLNSDELSSMLFRVSVPGSDSRGGPMPAPGFGTQLQSRAVFGIEPEAAISVSYNDIVGKFSDGIEYRLQKPQYVIVSAYIPLPAGIMLSPRVAPPVFGLGLLEAVSEQTIVALADPGDMNNDGISGRPNYVWDAQAQRTSIGRFGLKANTPTLTQQAAGAYNADMGVTSPLFPDETCIGQQQDDARGDDPEVNRETLDAVAHYTRTLGVPARRSVGDSTVRRGEEVFRQANCSGCHAPTLTTGSLPGFPEVSNQTIHPYTDLLLHDMGDGLSDGRPDFVASGNEWRTSPLWGIGLTQLVNGHTRFLHDGRARDLLEAILWHGGEASRSVEYVRSLPMSDREALVKFLNSL